MYRAHTRRPSAHLTDASVYTHAVGVCVTVCVSILAQVKETRLTSSLYEYWAGFLWGGFEYPLSKTSAIYQVVFGTFGLILISTYTANLGEHAASYIA